MHAEVVQSSEGRLFLRDSTMGREFAADEFIAIFDETYYQLVRSHSAPWALGESLVLFGAGQRYIWNPESKYSFFKDDASVRGTKLLLLTATAALYFQALQANRKVGESIEFLNASGAQRRYRRDVGRYQAVGAVTALYFIAEAIIAYRSFGATMTGDDLRIKDTEPIEFRDYLARPEGPASRNAPTLLRFAFEIPL